MIVPWWLVNIEQLTPKPNTRSQNIHPKNNNTNQVTTYKNMNMSPRNNDDPSEKPRNNVDEEDIQGKQSEL